MEQLSIEPEAEPQPPKPEPKRRKAPRAKPVQDGAPEAEAQPNILDRFQPKQVHRRVLKNAPYNPRTMSDAARRKLKAGLHKVGNLGSLNWNERTGNLIGGHQRIKLFDDANGTDNYLVWVDAANLTDAEEMEANILLNNPQAQGEYDFEKMAEMLRNDAVSIEGTGFDAADVYAILGDDGFAERSAEDINGLAEKLAAKREEMERVSNAVANRDASEFMIVFVCRSPEERDRVLTRAGLPLGQWHASDALLGLMKADGADDVAPDEDAEAYAAQTEHSSSPSSAMRSMSHPSHTESS